MKEIIEEALVKFGLNRAISKEEKEEAMRTFFFRREESILYFRKEKEYKFAITDWGIYYEQFDLTNFFKFRFNRYDKISWYEIESIKYDIKDYKFTFQLKENKKIYLTLNNNIPLLDFFF